MADVDYLLVQSFQICFDKFFEAYENELKSFVYENEFDFYDELHDTIEMVHEILFGNNQTLRSSKRKRIWTPTLKYKKCAFIIAGINNFLKYFYITKCLCNENERLIEQLNDYINLVIDYNISQERTKVLFIDALIEYFDYNMFCHQCVAVTNHFKEHKSRSWKVNRFHMIGPRKLNSSRESRIRTYENDFYINLYDHGLFDELKKYLNHSYEIYPFQQEAKHILDQGDRLFLDSKNSMQISFHALGNDGSYIHRYEFCLHMMLTIDWLWKIYQQKKIKEKLFRELITIILFNQHHKTFYRYNGNTLTCDYMFEAIQKLDETYITYTPKLTRDENWTHVVVKCTDFNLEFDLSNIANCMNYVQWKVIRHEFKLKTLPSSIEKYILSLIDY